MLFRSAILYERIVYGVTLLALLLEAALIYRPLVNRVRRATERLVRQQQFSDRVVDTSQALIIGLDSAGCIALFNQHSQKVTGHAEAEVQARWLLQHRGLAYIEANASQTLQPLNVADSRLARLWLAESLAAQGKAAQAASETKGFLRQWPASRLSPQLLSRVEAILSASKQKITV